MRWESIFERNEWLSTETYSVSKFAVVLVGGSSAAMLKHLYKPSMRFLAHKRRTIKHLLPNDELCVLACVHHGDNVPPILTLLEVSHPTHRSPICTYLLHLTPLAGRAAAVLVPYKKGKRRRRSFKATSSSSESDHIVNALIPLPRAAKLWPAPDPPLCRHRPQRHCRGKNLPGSSPGYLLLKRRLDRLAPSGARALQRSS